MHITVQKASLENQVIAGFSTYQQTARGDHQGFVKLKTLVPLMHPGRG